MDDSEEQNAETNKVDVAAATPPPVPKGPPPISVAPVGRTRSGANKPELKAPGPTIGEKLLGQPIKFSDTIVVVVLAIIADQCLYPASGGLGLACVMIGCVLGLFVASRKIPSVQSVAISSVILAVSAMMVWRCWWLVGAVGWITVFVLAVKLHRPDWRLPGVMLASAGTLLCAPWRLFGHVAAGHLRKRVGTDGGDGNARRPVRARVVLVPLIVCVVFVAIFAAANPVVGRIIRTAFENIGEWFGRFFELITPARLCAWALWLMLFAALIRPVVAAKWLDALAKLNEALTPLGRGEPDRGNGLAALVTLVLVNLLFLAYNGLDSVYLYLKATLPQGITWTTYTHSGCGWLTFALFVSSVVIGFMFSGGLNFHPHARRLKLLSFAWAAQNAVLAVGTARRIHMYIDFSGLTHLRLTGIYGALLVMAGLAIMVYKVHAGRSFVWLARKYVFALSVAVLFLALTPNDWLCASYNVRKVLEGKRRAMRPICLKELSPEALPPLIRLLDYERQDGDTEKEEMVRKGIAGLLGSKLRRMKAAQRTPWSRWQGSRAWALRRLLAVESKIDETADRSEWVEALSRLRTDYDLQGSGS